MAIKDLAVAYNGSDNANAAVDMALQMCRKYKAGLTAIYVVNPVRFEGNVGRWITDDIKETLRKAETEVTKSIEERFKKRVGTPPAGSDIAFVAEEGQPNLVLARHARYHDILLMGQFSAPGDAARPIRAGDLVLRTGRPLLIVPNAYEVRPFQEYAVVGWDGSRQAARALSDAMQILETKKRLDVVSVRASGDTRPPAQSDAIVRHLERHGIDARNVALNASREGIGQTLLDYCAEQGPDIFVMGAYGHTKLREDLFGGVTRRIMEHMTVPVLMSH
jgi:nucleotide-binding universal stress UspA family protein